MLATSKNINSIHIPLDFDVAIIACSSGWGVTKGLFLKKKNIL